MYGRVGACRGGANLLFVLRSLAGFTGGNEIDPTITGLTKLLNVYVINGTDSRNALRPLGGYEKFGGSVRGLIRLLGRGNFGNNGVHVTRYFGRDNTGRLGREVIRGFRGTRVGVCRAGNLYDFCTRGNNLLIKFSETW